MPQSDSRITIFDGNNYLRRKYEEDHDVSTLRSIVVDIRTELARKGNKCVFVLDGYRGNKYRRDMFPNYKGNRPKQPDAFRDQFKAIQTILPNLPLIVINVPEYEADDIIAALVGIFRQSPHFKDATYHIKSTDKDFHQLGVSYEGKGLHVPPEETVLFKCLVGDASDAIPGVPGFGLKKYDKLDKAKTLEWMSQDFPIESVPTEFHKTQHDWIVNNRDLLLTMRNICLFRPVPEGLIEQHSHFGVNNPQEVERILKENMA